MSKCGTVNHCHLTGFESADFLLLFCVESLCSPHVCVGSLLLLWVPPQICMLGNSKLTIDMNVSGMIGFLLCPVTDCHRL